MSLYQTIRSHTRSQTTKKHTHTKKKTRDWTQKGVTDQKRTTVWQLRTSGIKNIEILEMPVLELQ